MVAQTVGIKCRIVFSILKTQQTSTTDSTRVSSIAVIRVRVSTPPLFFARRDLETETVAGESCKNL